MFIFHEVEEKLMIKLVKSVERHLFLENDSLEINQNEEKLLIAF